MEGVAVTEPASSSWFDLTCEELAMFYGRVTPGTVLTEADCTLIQALVSTIAAVGQELNDKKASLARLKFILFGPRTERSSDLPSGKDKDPPSPATDEQKAPDPGNTGASVSEGSDDPLSKKPKKKRKGHGRNGADAYTGAERIRVPHQELKVGQCCPDCRRGRLHLLPDPATIIRLRGQPALLAKLFLLARLRCGACGEVFTADPPEEARGPKYDATAGAIVSILKYGCGFPSTRLEHLQRDLGVPVPATVQYEIASEVADALGPVFKEMLGQAAQRELFHNDDTGAKILDLDRSRRLGSASGVPTGRKGTFTTSIVARGGGPDIYLYITSWRHAGENLVELLKRRLPDRGDPIQMCDALSRNYPQTLKTIVSNCLTHGRRGFVQVATCFPVECRRVIDDLAVVYHNDSQTKGMSFGASRNGPTWAQQNGPRRRVGIESGNCGTREGIQL
jgi:hypothetical protein